MLYKIVTDRIIFKLNESGAYAEAEQLLSISSAPYMSYADLLGSIMNELTTITQKNSDVYKIIGNDISEFKKCCRAIGMSV